MFGAIAEYEKDMIVFKLRAPRERKRARVGKCEGRKSYIEASPKVVREVERLRRRRKGQKQMPFSMVARELNRKGFRSCSGTFFTGANVGAMLRPND
jgi:DNA invertase Pin-like site-specific DNA recombinase